MFDDNYSDSFDEIESPPKVNNKPINLDTKKPVVASKQVVQSNNFEIESDNDSLDFNTNTYQASSIPQKIPEKPPSYNQPRKEPSKTPVK